jgi:hypothetical protein
MRAALPLLALLFWACAGSRPLAPDPSYYAPYEEVWDAVHLGLSSLHLPVTEEEIRTGSIVTEWVTLSTDEWRDYCDCSATDVRGSARARSSQDAVRQVRLVVRVRNLEDGIHLETKARFRSLEDDLVNLPGGRVCMMPREHQGCESTGKLESQLAQVVGELLYEPPPPPIDTPKPLP